MKRIGFFILSVFLASTSLTAAEPVKPLAEGSEFYPGFEIIPDPESETSAQYRIAPKALLMEAFRFYYPHSSTYSPVLKCRSV